ncbi:winged helix-turn-helix domain-containing protein [Pararcticibacter amylolyticus]
MFTVTLRRRQSPGKTVGETVAETVGETSAKILAVLEENPYITRTQLSEFTGLSVRGVDI